MTKTILITGATDGIGLETAKILVAQGYNVLVHGRSETKLADTQAMLASIEGGQKVDTYRADLSRISDVEALAAAVTQQHPKLDVLINNAGVYKTSNPISEEGLDVRFLVNTIAPYLLTALLLPSIPKDGRVINLSSAAQAPVSLDALAGKRKLDDSAAYAQSKLAITMWTAHLAQSLGNNGHVIVAVNPASLLASKMVKDAYGVAGGDLGIGADILVRAALSDEFANASGKYFDNDQGQFAPPHADALNKQKNKRVVDAIEDVLATIRN